MPPLQVIALYYQQDYDRKRDEIIGWLSVPPSQGYGPLQVGGGGAPFTPAGRHPDPDAAAGDRARVPRGG
ncbi:MAG: hypothetical protein U0736_15850 [Gemmataceae bacterium]